MRNFICCIIILLLLFIRPIYAQKYDYQWVEGIYYTGQSNSNFTIDFNTFPPIVKIINSQYAANYTSGSISNYTGEYAFYSNGCKVFTKEHEIMDNGDSLSSNNYFCNLPDGGDNLRVAQGVFAIPLPLSLTEKYILFSVDITYPPLSNNCATTSFRYHTVDMEANQGLGKVIEKDQTLLEGCFQIACANRHANGRDWWIILADNQQSRFYRWLLTPTGIEGPWIQDVSNPTIDGYWFCGLSEFSPDGQRYIINACRTGVAVYDFDRCTGLLSSPVMLERSTIWNWSASYSPDSRFLYASDNGIKTLLQYDLTAPDVAASKTVVSEWDGFVDTTQRVTGFLFMQQGPDGKLYIWAGDSYFIHVVDFPNRQGINCQVRQRAIQLPEAVFAANLYYPRYRLGPIDGSSCDTLGIDNHPIALFRHELEDTLSPLQVTFTNLSYYEPTNWQWDFGDGTFSAEHDPVHLFTEAGIYNVCLQVSNAYSADTFCQQVVVGTVGIENLPALPLVRVSPNPFYSNLSVSLPALVGVAPRFVLRDLYGREVYSGYLRDFDTEIPLELLPTGMYVWQLYWRGVPLQNGKVVKM